MTQRRSESLTKVNVQVKGHCVQNILGFDCLQSHSLNILIITAKHKHSLGYCLISRFCSVTVHKLASSGAEKMLSIFLFLSLFFFFFTCSVYSRATRPTQDEKRVLFTVNDKYRAASSSHRNELQECILRFLTVSPQIQPVAGVDASGCHL